MKNLVKLVVDREYTDPECGMLFLDFNEPVEIDGLEDPITGISFDALWGKWYEEYEYPTEYDESASTREAYKELVYNSTVDTVTSIIAMVYTDEELLQLIPIGDVAFDTLNRGYHTLADVTDLELQQAILEAFKEAFDARLMADYLL